MVGYWDNHKKQKNKTISPEITHLSVVTDVTVPKSVPRGRQQSQQTVLGLDFHTQKNKAGPLPHTT